MLLKIIHDSVVAFVPGYESDMPAFKDVLTDEQIWGVIAYIKSLWTNDLRARHAEAERRSHSH